MKQRVGSVTLVIILLSSLSGLAVEPGPQELVSGEDYVPGEVMVKISGDAHRILATEAQVAQLIESISPGVKSVNPIFPVTPGDEDALRHGLDRWYKLTLITSGSEADEVARLRTSSDIEVVELNTVFKNNLIPNDEYFDLDSMHCQWALHNDDGSCLSWLGPTPDADIDAPEAWDVSLGSSSVTIGIFDTGINYNHEDLSGKMLADCNGGCPDGTGYDFVDTESSACDDADCTGRDSDPNDGHGHGTVCAGAAGAETDNGLGIAGVCPNCKLMPVRVCYKVGSTAVCEADDVAAGIYYAVDTGVPIISMSFGGSASSIIGDAVAYAASEDVILIAGAGNGGSPTPTYPAAYPEVIGVGGTIYDDSKWPSSNFGEWVSVAGPSLLIWSTALSGGYGVGSGTSMAAPIVAGEAGLVLSRNPGFSKAEVESIILGNVDPYYSEEYIGTGRINLWYALRSICEDGTVCPPLYECLPGGMCKLPCDSIGDCSSLGPSYSCIDGYCEDLAGVDALAAQPTVVSLEAVPDPFTNGTTIRFDLSKPGRVSLKVYDVSGRAVRTLASAKFDQGPHTVTWNATDDSGNRVSSGVYFCRIEAGGATQTRKMILAR